MFQIYIFPHFFPDTVPFCISGWVAGLILPVIANTVEPHYNEVLGTVKITLLYQVSHYIRVQKQRNIKS